MSSEISTSNSIQTHSKDAKAAQLDQYVSRQVERAAARVRWIEVATHAALVATIFIGSLLAFCIIDAWLISFSPFFRLAAFCLLVFGSLGYLLWKALPLLILKINPVYAAKMIEDAKPGLKNSLLNYLTLRVESAEQEKAKPLTRNVMQMLQNRAANDISQTPIENTVDRTGLIRIGFILVGILLLAGVYKMVSPKDPFQSLARLAAPLADISTPSRVRIQSVEPGDVEIYFGETVDITATVKGLSQSEQVTVVYSSVNGEIENALLPLESDETRKGFTGKLATELGSIQHSLRYYVVAGDTRSSVYEIKVSPRPTLSVEKMVLVPPKYTELPTRTIERKVEVDGIEGTRAQIHALANLDVQTAWIELILRDPEKPGSEKKVDEIQMQVDGKNAVGEMTLVMKSRTIDGKSTRVPIFTHYRLRFVSTDGKRSDSNQAFPVTIQPDMAPEIFVIQPGDRKSEVPLNRILPIQIEARDPDFQIHAIELTLHQGGRKLLQQALPIGDQNRRDRVAVGFEFLPRKYGLKTGDEVVMKAVAMDNRHHPKSQLPDPNQTRSDNYVITILPPEIDPEGVGSDPNDPNQKDPESKSEDQNDQNGDQSEDNKTGSQNSESDSGSGDSDKNDAKNGKSKSDNKSDNNDKKNGKSDDSKGQSDKKSAKADDKNDGKSKSDSKSDDGKSGDDGKDSGKNDSSGNKGDSKSGSNKKGNEKSDSKNKTGNERSKSDSKDKQSDQSDGKGDKSGRKNSDSKTGKGKQSKSDQKTSGNEAGNQQGADGGADQKSDGNDPGDKKNDPSNRSGNDDQNKSEQVGEKADQTNTGDESSANDFSPESDGEGERSNDKPLEKNAHDGDRFEKLNKLLNDAEKSKGDPNQNHDNESEQNSNGDNKPENGGGQKNDSGKSDTAKDDTKKSDGSGKADSKGNDPSKAKKDDGKNAKRDPADKKMNGDGKESDDKSDGPSKSNDKNAKDGSSDPAKGDKGNSKGDQGQQKSDSKSDSSKGNKGSNQDEKSGKQSQKKDSKSDGGNSKSSKDGKSTDSKKPDSSDSKSADNQSDGGQSKQQGADDRKTGKQQSAKNQPGNGKQTAGSKSNGMDPASGDQLSEEQKANLEYTRKVTDLVIDNLESQKNEPDPELLRQMNWTKEEMNEFLKRYQKMRENARMGESQAQQDYIDKLRSLGLKDPKLRPLQDRVKSDNLSGLNEDGAVSKASPEYAREFFQFQKNRNRVRRDSNR